MYATDFTFDNEKLSDYGLMICTFDGDSVVSGGEIEPVVHKTPATDEYTYYASEINNVLTWTFSICKTGCDAESYDDYFFDQYEESEIAQWLLKTDGYRWLHFDQDDKYPDVYYKVYINMTPHQVGGMTVGFDLTITSNCGYGFSHEYTATLSQNEQPLVINVDNDLTRYSYPEVTLQTNSDECYIYNANDLEQNLDNGKECRFKNLGDHVSTPLTITMDTANDIIEGVTPEQFNWYFLRLLRGENKIYSNGTLAGDYRSDTDYTEQTKTAGDPFFGNTDIDLTYAVKENGLRTANAAGTGGFYAMYNGETNVSSGSYGRNQTITIPEEANRATLTLRTFASVLRDKYSYFHILQGILDGTTETQGNSYFLICSQSELTGTYFGATTIEEHYSLNAKDLSYVDVYTIDYSDYSCTFVASSASIDMNIYFYTNKNYYIPYDIVGKSITYEERLNPDTGTLIYDATVTENVVILSAVKDIEPRIGNTYAVETHTDALFSTNGLPSEVSSQSNYNDFISSGGKVAIFRISENAYDMYLDAGINGVDGYLNFNYLIALNNCIFGGGFEWSTLYFQTGTLKKYTYRNGVWNYDSNFTYTDEERTYNVSFIQERPTGILGALVYSDGWIIRTYADSFDSESWTTISDVKPWNIYEGGLVLKGSQSKADERKLNLFYDFEYDVTDKNVSYLAKLGSGATVEFGDSTNGFGVFLCNIYGDDDIEITITPQGQSAYTTTLLGMETLYIDLDNCRLDVSETTSALGMYAPQRNSLDVINHITESKIILLPEEQTTSNNSLEITYTTHLPNSSQVATTTEVIYNVENIPVNYISTTGLNKENVFKYDEYDKIQSTQTATIKYREIRRVLV